MDDGAKSPEFRTDCSRARNAPQATDATRVALVSQQLGLSDADLEPFYYVNRKGSKKRFFNHAQFANEYGISLDWLYHGYLPEHPRHLEPLKPVAAPKTEPPQGSQRRHPPSKFPVPTIAWPRPRNLIVRSSSLWNDWGPM